MVIDNNAGHRYSMMVMQMMEVFKKEFPKGFVLKNTVELTIDCWNIAILTEKSGSDKLYLKELRSSKHKKVIEKLVNYKQIYFFNYDSMITDYELVDNKLRVESQPWEIFTENINSVGFTRKKITS